MSIEKIKMVTEQILNRLPAVKGKGEGATKQALVFPMLDALGYDIWNPAEVCPEYDADFPMKKAGQKEKVDIAILIDGLPRIFLELKSVDETLLGHQGQLARYFNATTSVTLGILTNGLEWQFFTDTGDPNVMDSEPFHIIKLDAMDQGFEVLARFAKTVFSPEAIRDYATELLYTAKMASFLRQELDLKEKDPSDYLIRWILKSEKMYDGVVNLNVVERFRPIVKAAITRVIREIVRRSITAMDKVAAEGTTESNFISNSPQIESVPLISQQNENPQNTEIENSDEGRAIFTTDRELQAFAILKEQFEHSALTNATIYDSSVRKNVPPVLTYKDTTAYFGIYFNKPSWWIIRVVMESKRKWIGFNVDTQLAESLIPEGMTKLEPHAYADFRIEITQPDDLHKLHRLVFAAFQKTINDHQAPKSITPQQIQTSDLSKM